MKPRGPNAAAGTDPGRERDNNEDRVLCDPERGIFAVIDGVGGESGGEIAAQTALEVLRARLSRRTTDLARLIREAIALANKQIYERALADPRLDGMACVLTVAVLDGDHATVGHVGDSRLYQLRRGQIRKVTRDHSPVGTREDAGEISEAEAMSHPRRNEIFRDVGSGPHEPDDEGFIDVQQLPFDPESALLFCSDGLSDLVPSARILEAVEKNAGNPGAAVRELIDSANAAGGKDNISIVLVEGDRFAASVRPAQSAAAPVAAGPRSPYGAASARPDRAERWVRYALFAALAALAVTAFLYFLPRLRPTILPGQTETPAPAAASVLRVGPAEADFASISEALAEARPGQTIEIAPGEYREALRLRDGIALVSSTPSGAVLRLPPGTAVDTPVVLAQGVRDARLFGLRIVSGADALAAVGLRLADSAVDVERVEVLGTTTAGIEIMGADRSTVRFSHVHDNAGTGVAISGASAPRLQNNLIAGNGRKRGALRPGIEVLGTSQPQLLENRIENNGGPQVRLPSAERAGEIFQWNEFGAVPQARAVQADLPGR